LKIAQKNVIALIHYLFFKILKELFEAFLEIKKKFKK